MNNQTISDLALRVIKQRDAIKRGHFVGNSGLHTNVYVDKNSILPFVEDVNFLTQLVATLILSQGIINEIDTVLVPEKAGIVFGHSLASRLAVMGKRVQSIFAEKAGDSFFLGRSYDQYVTNKKVIVFDDTVTEGGTVNNLLDIVIRAGGSTVAVACIVNRGKLTSESFGLPLLSLVNLALPTWTYSLCPMCREDPSGSDIDTRLGHGKQFLLKLREMKSKNIEEKNKK